MTKTYYVYYMLMRPVDLGAQPDKLVAFTDEPGTAPSGHHHWGHRVLRSPPESKGIRRL